MTIQATVRSFLAKCAVDRLRRFRAVIVLQAAVRVLRAKLLTVRMRRSRAAVCVQALMRRKLAYNLQAKLVRCKYANILVQWYHHKYAVKRCRAARKMVVMLRLWCKKWRYFAFKVSHAVQLGFRKRVVRAMRIQR